MNAFQQNKGIVAFCATAALAVTGLGAIGSIAVNNANQEPTSASKAMSAKLAAQKAEQAKVDLKAAATPKPSISKDEAVIGCQMQLEATLRDASSVRYDRNLTQYLFKNDVHNVTLVYNAKNGFGGYVGKDVHTCTFKN